MKRKVQNTILIVLALLIVVLLVGGLTALLFQGFYNDQNPTISLVSYALDFNRSVYVWLVVLLAAYWMVSVHGDAIANFVSRLHARDYPGPLRVFFQLTTAVLFASLSTAIVGVLVGIVSWNYAVPLVSYWQTHPFNEFVGRLFANLAGVGFLFPLGVLVVFVSAVTSFLVFTKKKANGLTPDDPRSPQ